MKVSPLRLARINAVLGYVSFMFCGLVLPSAAEAGVGCFHHSGETCSEHFGWDGVALNNTIIHVAPGVPPGRYAAGLRGINSAVLAGNYEMVVVGVNPDGSWSGGYTGGGVNYGNGINGWSFFTSGGSFNVPVTVTGDLPFLAGDL
ncbi:MAG TPA: hypothetical protein VF511_02170, partial [Chthoniobacterales bacterium]